MLRAKGRGVERRNVKGDLLVNLKIVTPKRLSVKVESLLQEAKGELDKAGGYSG